MRMKLETVKALIDRMAVSRDPQLEHREGEWHLRLTRAGHSADLPASAIATAQTALATHDPSLVLSPLYGIVHLQPAPDAAPFVRVGQEVKVGTALCVIEAMKVFNHVYAEQAGTVNSILIGNGQEVEVGQALMSIA
jgi:acetyl-CoA carboxylase biotin carboxyl carrier protein